MFALRKLIYSSLFGVVFWLPAFAGVPIVFSYQGKLLDQNGQALQDAFDFKIQLFDPTGTCLLYEEKQNNVALTSGGLFTLQVGSLPSDSKRGVGDPGLSMEKIFSNDGSEIRAVNTAGCYLGFTAQASDKRRMKVTVTNKTTAITTVLSPMQDIAMSPYSLHSSNASNADKVAGKSVSDLIVVENSVTQSNLRSLTDKVSDILGMVASGSGGGGAVNSVGAAATVGNPISVGGTVANPAIDISKATSSSSGYLSSTDWNTFNNKQSSLGFSPLNPANNLSDVASAATARSNLGLSTAGGDLTGTFPNPTLNAVGTAGTYTKVTTDSKGRVTGGSLINITDLKSSVTGNWLAATGACPAGQQLTFLSASDTLSCQAYAITSAQVVNALGFTPAASGGGGGGDTIANYTSSFTCGSSAIDFSSGTIQRFTPSNVIAGGECITNLSNLVPGARHSLVVAGNAAQNSVVYHFSGYNFRYSPANAATLAGKETIYNFLYDGTAVYVTFVSGFGDFAKFVYTGSEQTFVVPAGVNTIYVKVWGAGGGGVSGNSAGGAGAAVVSSLSVTPNESLKILVGQGGFRGVVTAGGAATFGGGGAGGAGGGSYPGGGSGGGRSAVRRGTDDLVTAAGGAGSARDCAGPAGGVASGLAGANGGGGTVGGGAGTQVSGGAAGNGTPAGTPGTLYAGGSSGTPSTVGGGGGGSGYYGGGAGGSYSGGAGGGACGGSGSSLVPAGGTGYAGTGVTPGNNSDPDYVTGVGVGGASTSTQAGNGLVYISW